ncbi:460_t:CDS:2 [Gigaspora margarita]|uniref:460_t:CDS:1 n=1 Tax=Gigaspora margarita TaxID=4874 RepID=A0ABN7V6V5_GIGMA|nr:460_t:CDS:2 [Gigaspora margarita]
MLLANATWISLCSRDFSHVYSTESVFFSALQTQYAASTTILSPKMSKLIYFDWKKLVMFCGIISIILAISFVTGALSQDTTFQTPDVLSISYIKKGLADCEQKLKAEKEIPCIPVNPDPLKIPILPVDPAPLKCDNQNGACALLRLTANDDPPISFSNMNSNGDFDKWARKKEYRGYIHIPTFNFSCNSNGQLVSFDPHDYDYADQHNPTQNPNQVNDTERNPYGYTKVLKILAIYNQPDIYIQSPFNGIQWSQINNNTSLAHDAPFIYARINMTVCCNRQISVVVSRSVFPETWLYINGLRVQVQAQADLGIVIVSGGKTLHDVGFGEMAPSGPGLTWTGKV